MSEFKKTWSNDTYVLKTNNYYHSAGVAIVYLMGGYDPSIKKHVYKIGFSKDPEGRAYHDHRGNGPLFEQYGFGIFILCGYQTHFYRSLEKHLHSIYRKDNDPSYCADGGTEWFLLTESEKDDFLNQCTLFDKAQFKNSYIKESIKPTIHDVEYKRPDFYYPDAETAIPSSKKRKDWIDAIIKMETR